MQFCLEMYVCVDSQGFKTLGKEPEQSCLFVQSLATSLQIQAALFSLGLCYTSYMEYGDSKRLLSWG